VRKKKPAKKKSGKKKSASRKKINRRKKPIQRRKATHSKEPTGGSSEQIHQGAGTATPEAGGSTNDVPENDVTSEHGGES
jgi:hypothetical protein